jgi:hypothetical protein
MLTPTTTNRTAWIGCHRAVRTESKQFVTKPKLALIGMWQTRQGRAERFWDSYHPLVGYDLLKRSPEHFQIGAEPGSHCAWSNVSYLSRFQHPTIAHMEEKSHLSSGAKGF